MLSQQQIERLVRTRSYHRLTQRVLSNGRCDGRQIQERLLEPQAAAPAALGLALRRIAELTYGEVAPGANLIPSLLQMQMASGLFVSPSAMIREDQGQDGSLAATAVAVKGLMSWLALHPCPCLLVSLGKEAVERGLDAITRHLDDARWRRVLVVDLVIVLWQLGDDAVASRLLDLPRFARELRRQLPDAAHRELVRHAYAAAA